MSGSKSKDGIDDKVAQAVIDAANAEAEKDEAEAELDQANADSKTVAAAHAAAALAETEAAKAKQRAAEEIEKDKIWLKEQMEISRKNSELLIQRQEQQEAKTGAIMEALSGLATTVQSLIPLKSEVVTQEVNPDKSGKSAEGQKAEDSPPPKAKPVRRFI